MQTATEIGNAADVEYHAFLQRFGDRARDTLKGQHVFTTEAEQLFEKMLATLPEPERQYYNCHACRDFLRRFGALVTIDDEGKTHPLFWREDDSPEYRALFLLVSRARVNGVFYTTEKTWGRPATGPWKHLAVTDVEGFARIYTGLVTQVTADQAMAQKREEFGIVSRALAEYTVEVLEQAMRVLNSDALYRSEKVRGPVEWLATLKRKTVAPMRGPGPHKLKGIQTIGRNLIWKAIAAAPAGFCHPRTSMAGTLLDDIAAGKTFQQVSEAFLKKMHPEQYHRSQVAPSAGNIAQAEKLVEQLGLRPSLARRYARLEEVPALWRPADAIVEEPEQAGGVFGHIRPKQAGPEVKPLEIPAQLMTWAKFRDTMLPTASRVEAYVPHGMCNFMGLTAAVDPEAPLLFQWNNHFSHYVWTKGSRAESWGLVPNTWVPVTAIALRPQHWNGVLPNHTMGVVFLLEGARDQNPPTVGLFGEILRPELRAVRATLEAYSNAGTLEGREEATACGLAFDQGQNQLTMPVLVRATIGGTRYDCRLDRWD